MDNVSTDDSVYLVETFGGRVIRNPRNAGLSAANNRGRRGDGCALDPGDQP
nr:hypothetical protein [Nocardia noduli]